MNTKNLLQLETTYPLAGDQAQAVESLVESIQDKNKFQTLLGVTGSGKTFTMANIIQKVQKPTIILAHNKTLAAQLYREFKEFFPHNAVEYFVSYYDYYQPEAYVPKKDLFIEKDSQVNEEIERLRISAMAAILQRPDVIIIATVSSIYGAGSPEDFQDLRIVLKIGDKINRRDFLHHLVQIQYERNEIDVSPGTFRVKGDIIDVFSAGQKIQTRIELFDDEVVSIRTIDPLTGRKIEDLEYTIIYPAKSHVAKPEKLKLAIKSIHQELDERIRFFKDQNKELEAQRIEKRTLYDLEQIVERGFCKGIEHYSRHIALKQPGETPNTLLHYFPKEFLCFVDESHMTIPQFQGMSNGDKARKENLVEYGFRLPSALDNRPLNFKEFEGLIPHFIFVSATPAPYEIEKSNIVARQIIRPTGLLDPTLEVRPTENQFDHIIKVSKERIDKQERVMITTITKKLAEEITNTLSTYGFKVRYLHGEIETVERVEILTDFRAGVFDILVGINLLREGLDLPEVSLVCILDADKIGFLRSTSSLIQIIGRAARNSNGHVIMYADKTSSAMEEAIKITQERRVLQENYNQAHHITPTTINKKVRSILNRQYTEDKGSGKSKGKLDFKDLQKGLNMGLKEDQMSYMQNLKKLMIEAADNLEFEKASQLRDEFFRIQKKM